MDDHFIAALKDQHDRLQQPRLRVESQSQFTVRPIILFEGLDPQSQISCLDRIIRNNPVLACASMDLHAA